MGKSVSETGWGRLLGIQLLVWCLFTTATAQCPSAPDVIVSTDRLQQLCANTGGAASVALACSLQRLCSQPSTSPPIFYSICNSSRLAITLCLDATYAATITECQQLTALYGDAATAASCLGPSALTLPSTADARASQLDGCGQMAGSGLPMGGCSQCTSASNCPDPLVSWSQGCVNMPMGQCDAWTAFCNADAAPGGAGAAVLCLPQSKWKNVKAPPRPPPGPPAPPTSPPPPPSPLSPPPSVPLPSPAPTSDETAPGSPPLAPQPPAGPLGEGGCVQDPTQASCASYVYPDATADLKTLCGAMPSMPACALQRACLVGSADVASPYCSSFSLLATGCADMPNMNGCASYVALCTTPGSVVEQCQTNAASPDVPSSSATLAAVHQQCSAMAMQGCADCTTTSCPDPLSTLSLLCSQMYMDGCQLIQAWCVQPQMSTAFPQYCGAGSTSDLPSMEMYFHQRVRDIILWRSWIPETVGAYVGSFIAIVAMCFVSSAVRTAGSCLCIYWKATRPCHPVGGERHWALPASQRQVAENIVTAGLSIVTTTLDFFAMLIVMSFNVGFFVAVVVGYVLGALLLSHVTDNYACYLAARKRAWRRQAATVAAAAAGTAVDANGCQKSHLQQPLLPTHAAAPTGCGGGEVAVVVPKGVAAEDCCHSVDPGGSSFRLPRSGSSDVETGDMSGGDSTTGAGCCSASTSACGGGACNCGKCCSR